MVTMFAHLFYGYIIAQTARPVLSDGNVHHIILENGCVVELTAQRLDCMQPMSKDDCKLCGVEIIR